MPLLLSDGNYDFLYGPNGAPIEQIDSGGAVTFLHTDQAGSVRLLTDTSGTITGSYSYDPWGRTTAHTGTGSTPLGYDGQYTDPESGLIYLRARYYDPATAQFLTRDPAVQTTQAPYNYTGNNPFNRADPTGMFFGLDTLVGAAVGAVIGGTASIVEQATSGNGINWSKVGIATAAGAAGGAAVTLCGSCGFVVDNAIAGGITGGLTNAGNQLYDSGSIDVLQVGSAATFGTTFGAVSGALLSQVGSDVAPVMLQLMSGVTSGVTGDYLSEWLSDPCPN